MENAFDRIKNCGLPVVIYGMGNGADKLRAEFAERGIEFSGVFANDEFVRGQSYAGFKVIDYERAKKRFGKFCVVPAFGAANEKAMTRMREIAEEQLMICPELPLFGGKVLEKEFLTENRERIEALYKKTEDALSREIFEKCLLYRLTGELRCLDHIMVSLADVFRKAEPNGDENFADFGAYNGDSIRSFLEAAGSFKGILAVEPDKRSFKKLEKYAESLTGDVRLVNKVISEKSGMIGFSAESSRNSHAEEGGIETPCVCGDELFADFPASIVKLDLEGHDMPALRGMANYIREKKPKLIVPIYHRTEDFLDLPEYILSLNPDYKLRFAKVNCYPCWDLFAIFA